MRLIATTCGSLREAQKIAKALIDERLCACVNIWPVRSLYRWNKKIKQAPEWALLCKTRQALAGKVEARILKLHSYNLPVVEQWEVKVANQSARKWLTAATR